MKQWSQVNVSLLLAIVVAIDAVGLDEIVCCLNWNGFLGGCEDRPEPQTEDCDQR